MMESLTHVHPIYTHSSCTGYFVGKQDLLLLEQAKDEQEGACPCEVLLGHVFAINCAGH